MTRLKSGMKRDFGWDKVQQAVRQKISTSVNLDAVPQTADA